MSKSIQPFNLQMYLNFINEIPIRMIQSESSLLAEKAKLKLMTDELKLIENELQTNGLQFWIFKEVMHFVIWKKV